MESRKIFCTYILASKPFGTLYTGITAHLRARVLQHKNKQVEGFTKKYNVTQLVFYQIHPDAMSAIAQEKKLKHWKRAWKIALIEKKNPHWMDLFATLDF